jgi:hypothetical protein
MGRSVSAAALAFAMLAGAGPAQACMVDAPIDLEDVQYADVVVVGRISNYAIVPDLEARRDRQRMLAEVRDLPADVRRELGMDLEWEQDLQRQTGFMTDYARFDIIVEEVLAGTAGRSHTVSWDNSTFGEPESMPPGPFLIALRDPRSSLPPLRGPSATITPNREPGSLTVLQAPCADAFIFERASEQATAVRSILERRSGRPSDR